MKTNNDINILLLSQRAIPLIIVPNGTVATSGVITLGTALPVIYPNAWVYLPAGAIVGGLQGLYFCQFTSTTVGQIFTNFNNNSLPFVPDIINNPIPAIGSNAGYTQVTLADLVLSSIVIPGGMMGINGSLRVNFLGSHNNSAGGKTYELKLDSTVIMNPGATTSVSISTQNVIRNRGVLNSQICLQTANNNGFGTAAIINPILSINTAIDKILTIGGYLAVATDYMIIEGFSIEILPSN